MDKFTDWTTLFQAGVRREDEYRVSEEHLATHVGSGSVRVLATPWMIAYMETTARKLLGAHLPAGYSSVGVHLDVRHLAPALPGAQVRSSATIVEVDGAKVLFDLQVVDGDEVIGAGRHTRVIIDEERFAKRLAEKEKASANRR